MSNVSTFGAFTMAKLGIYASQKAMQVTGNNITNINTKGYTRQSVDLTSLYVGGADRYASKWDAKVGSGVLVDGISQIRSPYLDIRYRTQNSTNGMEDTMLTGLRDLSRILDEVGKGEDGEGIMEASLQDLIEQISKYATENSHEATFDEIMKGSAKQLVDNFRTYARKLNEAIENQEKQYAEDVQEVNDILTKIQSLNVSIQKAEMHGSNALELKDERNLLIDDLSHYMRINVMYEAEDVGAGMIVDKLVIKLDSNDKREADPNDPNYDPNVKLNNDGAVLVDGKYVTQLIVPGVKVPEMEPGQYPAGSEDIPYGITLDVLKDMQGKTKSQVEGQKALWSTGEIKVKMVNGILQADLDANGNFQSTRVDADKNESTVSIADANFSFRVPTTKPDPDNPNETKLLTLEEQLQAFANAYNQANPNGEWRAELGNLKDRVVFVAADVGKLKDDDGNWTCTPPIGDAGSNITYGARDGVTPTDPTEKPIVLTDNDVYGALQASRELLTEEGEFASKADLEMDPNARSKYGIPYYQKLLDNMAVKFATEMNKANTLLDDNGNPIIDEKYYYETERDPITGAILTEADGVTPKYKLDENNNRIVREQYKGGVLFSNSGDGNDTAGITASNISIGLDWSTGKVHALQSREASEVDTSTENSNLLHFLAVLRDNTQEFRVSDVQPDEVAPGSADDVVYFKGTFGEMMTKIGNTLGTETSLCQSRLSNSNNTLTEMAVDRDSISGVDLNDEAISMMQYNKSYSAACRFMTTLDEMLDKLINGTAI